jgi:hypothetical protein
VLGGLLTAYEHLRASDEAVAKALGISEVAQIARGEGRLRRFLLATWNALLKTGVDAAVRAVRAGEAPNAVASKVHRPMGMWAGNVQPRLEADVERFYRLARKAGWRKATGQTEASLGYSTPNLMEVLKAKPRAGFSVLPSFDVADEAAINALKRQQQFWIGDLYDTAVADRIAETTRATMLEVGVRREAAAVALRERLTAELGHIRTPKGFAGSTAQYMEGLAANAATTARAQGQVTSIAEAGFTRVEIINPSDSRTCPVCAHMDGKSFTVAHAQEQVAALQGAQTPDDVKAAQPWKGPEGKRLTIADLREISPTPGRAPSSEADALAKAKIALPPYHFRCRCAVDVDPGAAP